MWLTLSLFPLNCIHVHQRHSWKSRKNVPIYEVSPLRKFILKTRKIILWLLAGLLAAVLIVAATLYLLCSIRPGQYKPAVLNPQQRTVAAKQFYRKVMDFDDGA